MKRSAFFIFSHHAAGDIVATDLVLGIRNRYPLISAYGSGGSVLMRTGLVQDMAPELNQAENYTEVFDRYTEKSVFQAAVLVGPAPRQKELMEILRSKKIPLITISLGIKDALSPEEISKMKAESQHVLCVSSAMCKALGAAGVRHSYIGFSFLDRASKVILEVEALGFSRGANIVLICSQLDDLDRFDQLFDYAKQLVPALKLADLQCVISLPVGYSWQQILAAVPGLQDQIDDAGIFHYSSNIKFTLGKKRELLSMAKAAVVSTDLDSLECSLADVPHLVIKDRHKGRDFCDDGLPVNLFAGKQVVVEQFFDQPVESIVVQLRALVSDEKERTAAQAQFKSFRESLSPYNDVVAMEVFDGFFSKQRSPRLVD